MKWADHTIIDKEEWIIDECTVRKLMFSSVNHGAAKDLGIAKGIMDKKYLFSSVNCDLQVTKLNQIDIKICYAELKWDELGWFGFFKFQNFY